MALIGLAPCLVCGSVAAQMPEESRGEARAANEFSLVPPGDPIHRHLSALKSVQQLSGDTTQITRYEIAVYTARLLTALEVERDHSDTASTPSAQSALNAAQWRALQGLIVTMSPELRRLGIETQRALRLVDEALSPTRSSRAQTSLASQQSARQPGAPLPSATQSDRSGVSWSVGSTDRSTALLPGGSFREVPGGAPGRDSSALSNRPEGETRDLASALAMLPLSQRLRAEAALQALSRGEADTLARASGSASEASRALAALSSSTEMSYDLNSWLRVRALASNRDLAVIDPDSPLRQAPLFAGASQAVGAGGGVDFDLGGLRFSTEVEHLETNTGRAGTRLGGGVGLSAWQNRLSLSAHLSRLLPEDRAALAATAAELNLGVDVNQRLSLGVQYQSLFTEQNSTPASRVSGGVSVRF